jgi:hypothetical protein
MPILLDLLDDSITFPIREAAEVLAEIGPPALAAVPRLRDRLTHGYEWVRVPCAAALWKIGGEAEAPVVLDILLQALTQHPATANAVVASLDRMGALAATALPLLREQLAQPQRGNGFQTLENDEELQHLTRTLIARLEPFAPRRALCGCAASDAAATDADGLAVADRGGPELITSSPTGFRAG